MNRSAGIELRDVDVSRGAAGRVLRGVNLAIDEGETVALVGRSGAGKSTILKLINGLLRADAGHVIVDGRATREWNPYQLRRRIGYVLQDVGLFPHMSVGTNVAVVPRLLGWDPARVSTRVDEVLALVGLPAGVFATRRPPGLSGGQRQRVGVARALAAAPPILLMDEPFGALDPVTRDALGSDYRALHDKLALTTLMITHDITEALLLADRIAVMRGGRLIEIGTPA